MVANAQGLALPKAGKSKTQTGSEKRKGGFSGHVYRMPNWDSRIPNRKYCGERMSVTLSSNIISFQ